MAKKKQPKQVKAKARILTIRATSSEDIKALEQLKVKTGAKTFSSAIFAAARTLPELHSTVETLRKQISDLVKIKKEQNELLHFIHSGQKQLEAYGKKFLKDAGKYPEPEIDFYGSDDE